MTELNMNPPVVWVDDDAAFKTVVALWADKDYLAIDTEFERRTTYFPILALVQIFDGETIYLIDPLKVGCPEQLVEIFANPKIIKILHAGKEDLEVFYCTWKAQLAGLFDTQVAYAFDRGVTSIGYANLVNELCQLQLDKEATQSDWLARPLSIQQLDYAAKDVLYLPSLYLTLEKSLASKKEAAHFFELECAEMCAQVKKIADFDSDYRDAKEVNRLNAEQLVLFKELYQWREETAMQDDLTRNHIAKDGVLVNIAITKPTSKRALQNITGLHPKTIRHYGEQIVTLIDEFDFAGRQPLTVVPNPRDVSHLNHLADKFLGTVQVLAQAKQIEPGNIASKRLVRKVALAYLADEPFPGVWSGWRGDLLRPHFNSIMTQLNATQED